MLPQARLGKTERRVTRLGLGGYPFGGVNHANGWDPFTPAGRAEAVETIHAALDAGITAIDTAPGYGDGNSERIIGEALAKRRDGVFLATKVGYGGSAADLRASVEASLRRLRTDAVDLLQFHGGFYTEAEVRHILDDGLLDEMEVLRDEGKARHLGFTAEEPWTARPLLASGRFDVMQVRYNLIYQSAAVQVLDLAREADVGVSVMRPLTSGILQRIATDLAPEWQAAHDVNEVALAFVLSDSRVHLANVGMRWPAEVERNVAFASRFEPPLDIAAVPRMTAGIYAEQDRRTG